MLVRKKMSSIQNMCSPFPSGRKRTKNYFPVPNKFTGNLITLVPRVFLFVDEAEHFIRLVMQNKSRT